uniref:Uncharacterized protein n=1 Tax=Avena sativa TaxID=4498 RepID=A0ACD5V3L3_AVESA
MVDMNPDHIFEVPDTPDRIQQSTCPVSSSAATRGITRMPGDPSPNRIFKIKIKTSSNQGQSSRGSAVSEQPGTCDLFEQDELARSLPEAKLSPPKLDRATGKSVVNGYGARPLGLGQRSSISNHMICTGAGVSDNSRQIREEQISHRDANRRYLDFLGAGPGLPTTSVGKSQNRTKTGTSNGLKEVSGADDFSGSNPSEDRSEAIIIKGTRGLSSRTPSDVPQRHVGPRRLVRNGCISPSNIVQRSVKAAEKQEMCSTSGVFHQSNSQADVSHRGNVIDLTDNSPMVTKKGSTVNDMETMAFQKVRMARAAGTLIPRSINQASRSNCSESSNNKGKDIIHDVMGAERSGEANPMRVCPRAVIDSSSVVNGDITGISSQQGWRTTHNHTSKVPMTLLGMTTTSCGIESGSPGPSNQGYETAAAAAAGDNNNTFSAATTTRSTSLRNRTTRISKGKRKYTSSSYHPGESSSSLNEHSGFLAASDTAARRNHTTPCHDTPVIDIDDISSPEVRTRLRGYHDGTSIDPNISAQLEADELLARQLQEQLYSETPRVAPREEVYPNREEIDAIVAMSLQHEEDAGRTSRTVRRFQNDTRAARASRSSAAHRAIRARYETAISHMRNVRPVTLGLRAMVAGYPASHIQPNIDLNDYDALLALDENNHQHTGASESQINNLPQSIFQSTSTEEPCAVCLENPSVGDTIRTLPCFHKFHKDCIDEWLRRKKLCPVCKCGITRS